MKATNFGFLRNKNYGISLSDSWIKSIIPGLSQNNILLQELYKNNRFSSGFQWSIVLVKKRHFAGGLAPIITSDCVTRLH